MMVKITHVEAKPDFVLSLTFDDGVKGEVSIADRLFGTMFEPLKKEDYFFQVKIDEYGVVYWPNEADLAPDVLHQKILQKH